ncbi:MAG: hypothetical protein M1834_001083 [Cirrosporium novae-zelandiae]|nr:MAG: hypothetical protein M1834_001083 [Cirrosporium novae-zelandiae]
MEVAVAFKISSELWEEKQPEIVRLYQQEGYPLRTLARITRSEEFHPSVSQLRSRLKRWNIRKRSNNKTCPENPVQFRGDSPVTGSTSSRKQGSSNLEANLEIKAGAFILDGSSSEGDEGSFEEVILTPRRISPTGGLKRDGDAFAIKADKKEVFENTTKDGIKAVGSNYFASGGEESDLDEDKLRFPRINSTESLRSRRPLSADLILQSRNTKLETGQTTDDHSELSWLFHEEHMIKGDIALDLVEVNNISRAVESSPESKISLEKLLSKTPLLLPDDNSESDGGNSFSSNSLGEYFPGSYPLKVEEKYDEENASNSDTVSNSTSYAQSIFSIPDSIASDDTLVDFGDLALIAANEIIEIMLKDEGLKSLCLDAVYSDRVGADRFENNFRRLLKQYSMDLESEAQDENEKKAMYIIHKKSRYMAQAIRRKANEEGGYKESGSQKSRLEDYLKHQQPSQIGR